MTNTAAIATKLNILESAIVRIEEWASVMFVVVKGLGARFVSKKVAKMSGKIKVTGKHDVASHLAAAFHAAGWKAKVWTGGKNVRIYLGSMGKVYVDCQSRDFGIVGKNCAAEWEIIRNIKFELADVADTVTETVAQSPLWKQLGFITELDYHMEHPNGMYYG